MRSQILRLNKKPYPAYKSLKRKFDFDRFQLKIDYVQGDPFAAPSRIILSVPKFEFSEKVQENWSPENRVPLCDFFGRRMAKLISDLKKFDMGSGKSGVIRIDQGGQYILDRASCQLDTQWLYFNMEIGLPAYGRRIAGEHCVTLLCEQIPLLLNQVLATETHDENNLVQHIYCYLNDLAIREELKSLGAIAFIADGSILPRESGDSQKPMTENAIPFKSPEELRQTITLPYEYAGKTQITGMLLPQGIHLITGGGYHGKSTLLQAISNGVYCNIPGDGRELVICDDTATHIKAEEGRSVCGVDIRCLISNLPGNKASDYFYSKDASGSTSQAASIVEAMESGSTVLLMDEDTSATNLLIRDARMQSLVEKKWEPITPLIDRIQQFYQKFGISTILIIGGCGDYLEIADLVLKMEEYQIKNVTEKAQQIVKKYENRRIIEDLAPLNQLNRRQIQHESIDPSRGKYNVKVDSTGIKILKFGNHEVDLRGLEQITDPSQLRAAALALLWIKNKAGNSKLDLQGILVELKSCLKNNGLKVVWGNDTHPGDLALPRVIEIAAILNRLRSLKLVQ